MPEVRINALPTTASVSASDDYFAIDGTNNNTRKLSAYSPVFGGNATLNGNLTVNGADTHAFNGTININGPIYIEAGSILSLSRNNPTYNNIKRDTTNGGMLFTANSNQLFFKDDGNLIVGSTVSTGEKLQVIGTAYISSNATVGGTLTTSGKLTVSTTAGQEGLLVTGVSGEWTGRFQANTTTGSSYGLLVRGGTNTSDKAFSVYNAGATSELVQVRGDGLTTLAGNLTVSGTGTSSFALGGKLGIGTTSPGSTLELIADGTSNQVLSLRYSTGASSKTLAIYNDGTNATFDSTAYGSGNGGNYVWKYNGGATPLMTLNTSGNLTVGGGTIALGTTASPWLTTLVNAFQLADNGASLSSFSTGNTSGKYAILSNNAYYDSGGWKYAQTAGTAQYRVANQEHIWLSAASGTGGDAISFTERMKLDSSGNLTVNGTGTTSFTSGEVALPNLTIRSYADSNTALPSSAVAFIGWVGDTHPLNPVGVNGSLLLSSRTSASAEVVLAANNAVAARFGASSATLAGNLTVSGTGTNVINGPSAAIATSGSGVNGTLRLTESPASGAMLMFGTNGGNYGYAQMTNSSNLSASYPLSLNPNGGNVLLGTTTDSGNGKLQLASHTTSAGGIGFGTDTGIWRQASSLIYMGNLTATSGLRTGSENGTVQIGNFASDTGTISLKFSNNNSTVANIQYSGGNAFFDTTSGGIYLRPGGTTALTLDSSQNATFVGTVTTVGVKVATTVKTANYTVTTSDHVVICNSTSAFTITMIAASANSGRQFIIKNKNTGEITISATSLGQIDGVDTITLSQYQSALLVSDGTTWNRI